MVLPVTSTLLLALSKVFKLILNISDKFAILFEYIYVMKRIVLISEFNRFTVKRSNHLKTDLGVASDVREVRARCC